MLFLLFIVPGAPENLTISSVTFTSITVTWDPPAIPNGNISIYQVQIAISNPNNLTTVKKIKNVTTTMFTTHELMPSTTYEVTVKAFTGAGSGPGVHTDATTEEIDVKPLWSKPYCPRVCTQGCMCCACTVGLHVLCMYSRFACVVRVQ